MGKSITGNLACGLAGSDGQSGPQPGAYHAETPFALSRLRSLLIAYHRVAHDGIVKDGCIDHKKLRYHAGGGVRRTVLAERGAESSDDDSSEDELLKAFDAFDSSEATDMVARYLKFKMDPLGMMNLNKNGKAAKTPKTGKSSEDSSSKKHGVVAKTPKKSAAAEKREIGLQIAKDMKFASGRGIGVSAENVEKIIDHVGEELHATTRSFVIGEDVLGDFYRNHWATPGMPEFLLNTPMLEIKKKKTGVVHTAEQKDHASKGHHDRENNSDKQYTGGEKSSKNSAIITAPWAPRFAGYIFSEAPTGAREFGYFLFNFLVRSINTEGTLDPMSVLNRTMNTNGTSGNEGAGALRPLADRPFLHVAAKHILTQYVQSVHGVGDVLAMGAGVSLRLFKTYPDKYLPFALDELGWGRCILEEVWRSMSKRMALDALQSVPTKTWLARIGMDDKKETDDFSSSATTSLVASTARTTSLERLAEFVLKLLGMLLLDKLSGRRNRSIPIADPKAKAEAQRGGRFFLYTQADVELIAQNLPKNSVERINLESSAANMKGSDEQTNCKHDRGVVGWKLLMELLSEKFYYDDGSGEERMMNDTVVTMPTRTQMEVNDIVKIKGLKSSPEHNERHGKIVGGLDPKSGRFKVEIETSKCVGVSYCETAPEDCKAPTRAVKILLLKPENLELSIPHLRNNLKQGDSIKVVRLKNKPELNGKCGEIHHYDAESGRYAVVLDQEDAQSDDTR